MFPHQRALDRSGLQGLEEERRLAYVGLTRARRRVFISHAANRRVYNQWQSSLPSRFIGELPAEAVERSGQTGLYGGGTGEADVWGGGAGERWRRRPATVIDAPSWRTVTPAQSGTFRVGDRVFHQKFGYGRVNAVDDNKLEIAFDKAGTKKVIDSFVEIA